MFYFIAHFCSPWNTESDFPSSLGTSPALLTRFSPALGGEPFIVSLLFLNSCAYLWWFCEWCKCLSKKSLCWAANPLISSTRRVGTNHLVSKKELAKFGDASDERCSCSCSCRAEKENVLLSETQLSLVLAAVVFTACSALKDLWDWVLICSYSSPSLVVMSPSSAKCLFSNPVPSL